MVARVLNLNLFCLTKQEKLGKIENRIFDKKRKCAKNKTCLYRQKIKEKKNNINNNINGSSWFENKNI